ncbi:hypothetical protein ABDJ41_19145 [Pedobacter sp. ASV1-7]|uniref:hypothetical protein n=1 Tax=Pedobacter sp. ASV1-7 TaxID=3145237 RepID=UPI0032E8B437
MTQIDFKKVFSKLSHIKALSHDQKFEQVVQNLITYAIFNSTSPLQSENDVSEAIESIYGISIRLHIIQSNVDKLLSNGSVTKDRTTKKIELSAAVIEKIAKRISDSNNLESKVRGKWLLEISQVLSSIEPIKYDALWKNLTDYLFNVFEQHGIETLTLLNPSNNVSTDDQKSLLVILDKVIAENKNEFEKETLVIAINQFILKADEERTTYISQLVDATFTSFALTSDSDTVNFLNNRLQNLVLFLDTNFIFGILDLHKNTEDASAREILSEIKKNKFPFKLTYHPETLSEFKRAFDAKALFIKSTKWSRETSRLALEVDGLSPLEELYHKENVNQSIDPDVFLDKYDHVDLIIKDLGLIEHNVTKSSIYESADLEEDIAKYQSFYEAIRHRKPKSYQGFKHDIEVLREVRSLNHKKTKFLESKAFFISSDYILSKFEKEYYKKRWEISFIIAPSTFLQLIRPFIQNDYQANKKFIDTFSIPDLRTFEIDYTNTRSKTLQILNDSYHDTSFETKVNILRDQVLLEKFDRLKSNHDAQIELIENRIAVENSILSKGKQEAEIEIQKLSQEFQSLETSKIEVEKEATKKNDEINKLKSELGEIRAILEREQSDKALLEWENNKMEHVNKGLVNKRKEYNTDFRYSFWPFLSLIILGTYIFAVSRFYFPIKEYLVPSHLSERWYVIIVIILGVASVWELGYRTYVVDKTRMAQGLKWMTTFGISRRKSKLLNSYSDKFEEEYHNSFPKPF